MDKSKWPALTGLTLGTIILSRGSPNTFAFDNPIYTSTALLTSAGAVTLGVSRFLPRDHQASHKGGGYEAIPLTDAGEPHSSRESSPIRKDVAYPSGLRKLRIVVLIFLTALLLRIGISLKILAHIECKRFYLEPLIPLVFAFWDFWSIQRHKTPKYESHDEMADSIYDSFQRYLTNQPYLYLVSVYFVCVGSITSLNTTTSPLSTFICAATQRHRWSISILRLTAFPLDVILIFCLTQLLEQRDGRGHRSIALRFASIGWSLIVSAAAFTAISFVHFLVSNDSQASASILVLPNLYFQGATWLISRAVFTFLCALFAIYHVGIMTTTLIVGFVSMSSITLSNAWTNLHPFPPTNLNYAYLGSCLAILGIVMYCQVESVSVDQIEGRTRQLFAKVPAFLYVLLLTLWIVWSTIWFLHTDVVNFHPIDMLIYEAHRHHDTYLKQALSSETLSEAVSTYKERYHRYPPAGFDAWYLYATGHDSVVIDDYDSVHRNISPFFALSPAELRQRTWQLISNQWNNITGIAIRGGKASLMSDVAPAHRWIADGLVGMVGSVAENLPDMDLAFNLDDRCRVAVPFEEVESTRVVGIDFTAANTPENTFSNNRADQWTPLPREPIQESPFMQPSRETSFYDFGSVTCPPKSPARNMKYRELGELCISCTYPHSLGGVIANWTLAADVCQQPDLRNLHETYASTEFKGTHSLYPVFSHAKVQGFNDILYPSVWDYLNDTAYAPTEEFKDSYLAEKNNSLFWRGTFTSDTSPNSIPWEGRMHQRFVHLIQAINGTDPQQPLLLPEPFSSQAGKLEYTLLPTSQIRQLLSANVKYTGFTGPCSDAACTAPQEKEFGPPSPTVDFQSHWQYRYLLDLDGPGFSPSSLPFLRSRSLPFKAGIYREWWADRLTPWMHFVPLDVRGHGLWATLAYFMGLDGKLGTEDVKIEGHLQDAARIADAGREWAGKVLRKVDMEIYLYRLLLEWARLTDDRRDVLGFDLVEEVA